MKIELVTPPEEGELMTVADRAYAMAAELVIDSQEMASAAAEELRAIAKRKDALDAKRKEFTSPLDDLKKKWMDLFRKPIARYEEAEATLKRALLNWNTEQAKIRAAEEARRRAEADAERARLEEIARQQREEAARLAEAASVDPALFGQAEQAASVAEHAEVMSQMVVAPPPAAPAPKVEGTSVRTTLEVEVTDKKALLAHVAAVPALAGLFDVNMVALRGMAKTLGAGSIALPGVVIREKQTIATSRR